jgi:AAA domain
MPSDSMVVPEPIDRDELVIVRDHEQYLEELLQNRSENEHSAISCGAFDDIKNAFSLYMDKEFRDEDELITKMNTNPIDQLIRDGLAIKAPPDNTKLEEIEEDSSTLMTVYLQYAVGSIYMIKSRSQVVITSSLPEPRSLLLKERIKGQITEFKKGEVSITFMQPIKTIEQAFNQYTMLELSPDAITKERSNSYIGAFQSIYETNILTRSIVNYMYCAPDDLPHETLRFLAQRAAISDSDVISVAIRNNTLENVLPITRELNESQKRAFKMAWVNNGIFLLHGPPGTGKSRTLLAIIAGFLKAGKRILVTSHTNQAIDKLLEEAHKNKLIEPGRGIRIGDMTTQDRQLLKYNLKSACAVLRKEARLTRQSHDEGNPETAAFANANIVFATLVGSWKDNFVTRFGPQSVSKFDAIIIDEASQAHLLSTLMPICMGLRVIMAGDHKQLPPCLMGDQARGSQMQKFAKYFSEGPEALQTNSQSDSVYKQSLFERLLTKNFLKDHKAPSGFKYHEFGKFNSSDYLVDFV